MMTYFFMIIQNLYLLGVLEKNSGIIQFSNIHPLS